MRAFILVVLLFSSSLLAEEDENYLGSSYNVLLAFEPSCLHVIGSTDVYGEHVGGLAKLGFCEAYADDSQTYLDESFYVGTGASFYSNSIYRDSFFLALTLNLAHSWVRDVVNDTTASQYAVQGVVGTGYQFHFQRGYILSLVMYFSYKKPFSQTSTSDQELAEHLPEEEIKYLPTFLVGWRF